MRLVIVGAGAVGAVLGVNLEHGKHEVIYLVRPGRKAKLGRLLLVNASSGETRCRERPQVFEIGQALPPFEGALLAVRGDQADEAMALVNQQLPPSATVVIAAALEPGAFARLRAAHPGGRVVLMAPTFSAWSEEEAVWRWFLPPLVKTLLSGEGDPAADERATELAAALTAVGLPARAVPSVLRSTGLPAAAGMALLAGWELAGWDIDALARDGRLRALTAAAMAEAARAAGDEADHPALKLLARAPTFATSSVFGAVLVAARLLLPKRARAMWQVHGPKVRQQTRQILDGMVASQPPERVGRLRELREQLPSI